jgi:high-affinity Fe2+/Pb2+ permease
MKDTTYMIVSGVIFGLWIAGQLARLIFQIPVRIETWNVPIWPTFTGTALAVLLCVRAFWWLRAGRQQ